MASTQGTAPVDSIIDWGLARSTADRLIRPGPEVAREVARQAVADLRDFASVAEGHVRDYTGLHATASPAPVVVVDRRGWAQANTDSFRKVLIPLGEKVERKRAKTDEESGPGGGSSTSFAMGLGSRITGLEAGAVLAFLAGKVLGQFDPFWSDGGPVGRVDGEPASGNGAAAPAPADATASSGAVAVVPPVGRLLLVAPNVVQVERELDVVPRDFRLWVCVHEETHRVQFTAVPWLRNYVRSQIATYLEETELDPRAMFNQLRQSFDQVGRGIRNNEEVALVDLVQSPRQRELLDRLTAVMSLLEGHADVVMDGVGPEVIPTVQTIRERFQQRRKSGSWGDQLLKRLLGLDAKMRQYRDGAKFVRHVVERVDREGFNQVWTSPETLPTKAELVDPDAWLRRVHAA